MGKHSLLRPEILCTHRAQHTLSEWGHTAATRMDGLTRPESMWAQQSKCDQRPPPCLLKPLRSKEKASVDFGDYCSTTVACADPMFTFTAHLQSDRLTTGEGTWVSGSWKQQSNFTERNTRVKWSNKTPLLWLPGCSPTSVDSLLHTRSRPQLIINLWVRKCGCDRNSGFWLAKIKVLFSCVENEVFWCLTSVDGENSSTVVLYIKLSK